jgi:signal transduction histidine kinase
LKENEAARDIPVIFISALQDPKIKASGLEIGGVDYISKPFDFQELLARVKTHLTIKEQEVQIRDYAAKLEEMVQERTRQLIHSDRLATLGTFAAAMVHEINNPNTYVIGNAELLKEFWAAARPIVEEHAEEDETGEVVETARHVDDMLDAVLEGGDRIGRIVKSLKRYAQKSETKKEKCRLMDTINDAFKLIRYTQKRSVALSAAFSERLEIFCDRQKMSQVFVNLFNNAIDAINDSRGRITVKARPVDDRINIQVQDNGPGIPEELCSRIFEPFFSTKGKAHGTGLGLFIVRQIIEEHGGEISLGPDNGNGAKFDIMLPMSG